MKQARPEPDLLAILREHACGLRKRGRPRADSVADLSTGARAVALEVYRRAAAFESERGALADAIVAVAAETGRTPAAVKRAVSRYRDLRAWVAAEAALDTQSREHAELVRRMRYFPADVRAWLAPMAARSVLALLRAERINGECPMWLADLAQRKRGDER